MTDMQQTQSSNPANQDTQNNQSNQWERDLVNRLAFASLNEQRRARKWGVFFRLLIILYLFVLLFIMNPDWQQLFSEETEELIGGKQHTALVELNGLIASEADANAEDMISSLRSAFKDKNTKGVILRINTPGGSPVQARYIYSEIKRLKDKHPEKPLYAVVTDMCTSGGYYVAVAADKIFVDKASIVGSIGVILSGGFGFVEAIDKLGIERRLYAAGENKAFLDPFSPEDAEEVEHIKMVLNNIHEQFKETVREGRGERLKEEAADIFSGLIWSGEQAVDLGLVDAVGNSSYVAREVIEAEKIVDFTKRPDYFDQFAERLGTKLGQAVLQEMMSEQKKALQ